MCQMKQSVCGCSLRAGAMAVVILDGCLLLSTIVFSSLTIALLYDRVGSLQNHGFLVAIGLAKMALLLVKTLSGIVAWCAKFSLKTRVLHLGAHSALDILELLLLLPFYIFYALWLEGVGGDVKLFLIWHFLLFLGLYGCLLVYIDFLLLSFYKEEAPSAPPSKDCEPHPAPPPLALYRHEVQ